MRDVRLTGPMAAGLKRLQPRDQSKVLSTSAPSVETISALDFSHLVARATAGTLPTKSIAAKRFVLYLFHSQQ